MKYHDITKDDMLNGDGLRTVLWVSGCNHHCAGQEQVRDMKRENARLQCAKRRHYR